MHFTAGAAVSEKRSINLDIIDGVLDKFNFLTKNPQIKLIYLQVELDDREVVDHCR